MFITRDEKMDRSGGLFHRLLDPMGMSILLEEVDRILETTVGETTLREFLRSKRNKLATHRTLAFSNQPSEVQAVTHDKEALRQYSDAMREMEQAVFRLEQALARMEGKESNRTQVHGPNDAIVA
jgi:hypothetical protein